MEEDILPEEDFLPELTPEEESRIESAINDLYEGPVFQRRLEAYYFRQENEPSE